MPATDRFKDDTIWDVCMEATSESTCPPTICTWHAAVIATTAIPVTTKAVDDGGEGAGGNGDLGIMVTTAPSVTSTGTHHSTPGGCVPVDALVDDSAVFAACRTASNQSVCVGDGTPSRCQWHNKRKFTLTTTTTVVTHVEERNEDTTTVASSAQMVVGCAPTAK